MEEMMRHTDITTMTARFFRWMGRNKLTWLARVLWVVLVFVSLIVDSIVFLFRGLWLGVKESARNASWMIKNECTVFYAAVHIQPYPQEELEEHKGSDGNNFKGENHG